MNLSVFNGSPRGKNSNSSRIISWVESGVRRNTDSSADIYYLNRIKEHDEYAFKLAKSDVSIIIFPLYTDSMPGIVMAFIEKLVSFEGTMKGRKLGFIVHSGFPEPAHSRYAEEYLKSLCARLGADYMGTAVLGGSEGFRIMPESMTRKHQEHFSELGNDIVGSGRYMPETLKKIAGREKLTPFMLFAFRVVSLTGLTNFYWNGLLKKNNAFDKRFAKPYI